MNFYNTLLVILTVNCEGILQHTLSNLTVNCCEFLHHTLSNFDSELR